MNIKINLAQASTKRGLIWLVVGIIGLLLLLTGHKGDIETLLLIGGTVAGGMGVALDDKSGQK
jgi:hypothetical protein